jgi:hypothetical protein
MALLKMVLLAKGLWHVCDPSAPVVTRPVVKIEKGAAADPNYVPLQRILHIVSTYSVLDTGLTKTYPCLP